MKNIFSIILIVSLGFGCSTSRSTAGGFAIATGVAMGLSTVGIGVARGLIDRPSSEVPFAVGMASGALLSGTFLSLGRYLLSNESRSERELFAQQLEQVEEEVEESQRNVERNVDQSRESEVECRRRPPLDYPGCMENVQRIRYNARSLDTDNDGVRDIFDHCINTPRGPQRGDSVGNYRNWLNGCPVGFNSDNTQR